MSNYTAKMVDAIKAASPLDLGKAKDLAADFGVSYRSVISKAISLGVQYNKQPASESVRTTTIWSQRFAKRRLCQIVKAI